MGYKCAPQLVGLVRGEPAKGQKHRANVKAIASEAGKERISASETLDRDRSEQNVYEGCNGSGFACADAITKEANEYRQKVKGKTKAGEEIIRERSLREDAVVGWAMIFNPPDEMTSDWTIDDYRKFDRDSWETMCKIEPRLFRDENMRFKAEHHDEGVPREDKDALPGIHYHRFGVSKNEKGEYCGNLISRKLFEKINLKYPALMREKGYDFDDLDVTDWKKFYEKDGSGNFVNEEYRAERKNSMKKHGKSNTKYVNDKVQENLKQSEALLDEAENIHAVAVDFMEQAEGADAYAADVKAKTKREKEKMDANLRRQKQKLQAISDKVEAKQEELKTITDQVEVKRKGLRQLEQMITEGLEMRKQIDVDLPEDLYEWLKTKEYRVLDTETIFVSPTSMETKEVIKKDAKGRPLFKTVNPLQDYADYLHGKERGQTLTDEQRETLEDIRREVRRQNQKEDEYSF